MPRYFHIKLRTRSNIDLDGYCLVCPVDFYLKKWGGSLIVFVNGVPLGGKDVAFPGSPDEYVFEL